MISYYDLLGMIKDGTQPKQIKYYDKIYKWGYSNYVYIDDNTKYLVANINEINMFKKNIEIIEEDKDIEEIEQIMTSKGMYTNFDDVYKDMTKVYEKVDEIIIKSNKVIKEVNKLRKEDK